jgi:hypothetical protein
MNISTHIQPFYHSKTYKVHSIRIMKFVVPAHSIKVELFEERRGRLLFLGSITTYHAFGNARQLGLVIPGVNFLNKLCHFRFQIQNI